MKKKRNILMTILTVTLLLGLVACADSGAQLPENNVDTPADDEVFDATEDTARVLSYWENFWKDMSLMLMDLME